VWRWLCVALAAVCSWCVRWPGCLSLAAWLADAAAATRPLLILWDSVHQRIASAKFLRILYLHSDDPTARASAGLDSKLCFEPTEV